MRFYLDYGFDYGFTISYHRRIIDGHGFGKNNFLERDEKD